MSLLPGGMRFADLVCFRIRVPFDFGTDEAAQSSTQVPELQGGLLPGQRSGQRQRYCLKSECRKVRKRELMRAWLAKPENENYSSGTPRMPSESATGRRASGEKPFGHCLGIRSLSGRSHRSVCDGHRHRQHPDRGSIGPPSQSRTQEIHQPSGNKLSAAR